MTEVSNQLRTMTSSTRPKPQTPSPMSASPPLPSLDQIPTFHYFGVAGEASSLGLWSGLAQNMHPKSARARRRVGALTLRFMSERWERLFGRCTRSVASSSTPTGRRPAARSATTTRPSKGRMDDGGRYHALDPDVFYWAHAAFCMATSAARRAFGPDHRSRESSAASKSHAPGTRAMASRCGPSPTPAEDFLAYWDHVPV